MDGGPYFFMYSREGARPPRPTSASEDHSPPSELVAPQRETDDDMPMDRTISQPQSGSDLIDLRSPADGETDVDMAPGVVVEEVKADSDEPMEEATNHDAASAAEIHTKEGLP